MIKTRRTLLTLGLVLATVPALADDDCDVPLPQWRTRDEVMRSAAQRGWRIERLKIDDGCYEIRGRDAQGRAFKAKLDPQTLEPVKMQLRDHDRDRDRKRIHQPGAAASGAAGASAPVPAPGTRPRATIE